MEQVRSFIAIEMPPEVKLELSALLSRLQARRHAVVKWVEPENIHLTLKFLGGVPFSLLTGIADLMKDVAKTVSPFCLNMEEMGAFPGWQRPQVVWVGLGGDIDTVLHLQASLEKALVPLGFRPEGRPFRAHLTLGRLRERATLLEKQELGTWARSCQVENKTGFTVRDLSLMKSQLTPKGPIYSILARVELGTP